ncbi:TPA: hypothetical protein ACH3X2_002671 [Trebouxia sp. C0005]
MAPATNLEKLSDTVDKWSSYLGEKLKPVVHYGFIPCIVILGMTMTEPRPTLVQLVGPM